MTSTFRYYASFLFAAAAILLSTLGLGNSARAEYPERSIRLVVPYPAGGSSDIVARIVGEALGRVIGQTILVENIGGAGGANGAKHVANSVPDGYTLLLGANSELLINKAFQPTLDYDALRDFTPLVLIGSGANVVLGKPGLTVTSWPDLVDLAKASKESLTYGTSGYGTIQHLVGETIRVDTNINMRHVPYRGGGPLLNDLIGGHIDLGITTLAPAIPFIKNGNVKAYLVTSAKRAEFAPNIPAAAEIPELKDFILETWYGIFAPAKLSGPVATKLQEKLLIALADPELKEKLAAQAVSLGNLAGPAFRNFIATEQAKYQGMVEKAKLR